MNQQIVGNVFDTKHAGDVSMEAAETYIRAALQRIKEDRAAGMASLDDMFRAGRPPRSLDGNYRGELLAVEVAPGITQLIESVQSRFHFWHGKTFYLNETGGDNVLNAGSRLPFKLLLPLYHGSRPDTATTFRALHFRTYTAPALFDPDVPVLKIDYDLPENPRLSIRRVLDELVELSEGYYLGRAYARWWWGKWQRVAYFNLRMSNN